MNHCAAISVPLFLFSTCSNFIKNSDANTLHTPHENPKHWPHYEIPTRDDKYLRDNLRLQGQNYAGRTQFPWLAEIRSRYHYRDPKFQEDWSNANMISSKYAITTCLAVADFVRVESGSVASGVKNYIVKVKDPNAYKVMYSDNFPFKTTNNVEDLVGTRQIEEFHPHPLCSFFVLDYQLGVAEIKGQPINPLPPYTMYLPVDFDAAAFTKSKLAFVKPEFFTKPDPDCYLGLWGRTIYDRVENSTEFVNYKLRYHVIWVDPQLCKDSFVYYPEMTRRRPVNTLECMALNDEKMGTICNHDRGAPVVCKGVARAFLLTGALAPYCNNSRPLPFLVIDIQYAFPFYSHLNSYVFAELELQQFGIRSEGSRHIFNTALIFVLVNFGKLVKFFKDFMTLTD